LRFKVFLCGFVVVLAGTAGAQTEITRSVVGSGGLGAATATVQIRSTLGQPVIDRVAASQSIVQSGFWSGGFPIVNSVEDDGAVVSVPFALFQNAPNPFNPRTTIAFSVPASAQPVSLRIYDLRGRQVRALVDEVLAAGQHRVTWDGRDDRDRPLASGIYTYTLTRAGERLTRKMLLVR
jgi:hypothetical protein